MAKLSSDHHGLLIIPIHWLASSLCLLSTNKLVCGGRSGAIWLPSHHPGGCCTLVVDEEISPLLLLVKVFLFLLFLPDLTYIITFISLTFRSWFDSVIVTHVFGSNIIIINKKCFHAYMSSAFQTVLFIYFKHRLELILKWFTHIMANFLYCKTTLRLKINNNSEILVD